jgi:hypothetical protein
MTELPDLEEWKEHHFGFYVSTKPGASPDTLLRRTTYGGRKARSARRRLSRLPVLTLTCAIKALLKADVAGSPSEGKDADG